MIDVVIKPSAKAIKLLAKIERLSGNWDRISINSSFISPKRKETATDDFANALATLDTSVSLLNPTAVRALNKRALGKTYDFNVSGILSALEALNPELKGCSFRKEQNIMELPGEIENQEVFATVAPYVIKVRLDDLIAWAKKELSIGTYHPLLVVAVFWLLLLHINPFPNSNQRLCALLCRQMMIKAGFSAVEYAPNTVWLSKNIDLYCQALKQAEKNIYGTWAGINMWFECFLQSILSPLKELVEEVDSSVESSRATDVQQLIIDIVKKDGPVTRERIVEKSGIKLATVKYNIGVLFKRGVIKRLGAGRTTSYLIN